MHAALPPLVQYQSAAPPNPYMSSQSPMPQNPCPAPHPQTNSAFPAPAVPAPSPPVQQHTSPPLSANNYNPLNATPAYPAPSRTRSTHAYPDFSGAAEYPPKYPDLSPTDVSTATLYPDLSMPGAASGSGNPCPGTSSPTNYESYAPPPSQYTQGQGYPQQPPQQQNFQYPEPVQYPTPSAPPMPGVNGNAYEPYGSSYHPPEHEQRNYPASSIAVAPPAGYPVPVPRVPRPPPLSNGPTPPASPPREESFLAHGTPPNGYPRPNHGAPPPSNLSCTSSASAVSSTTHGTNAATHTHSQHAWGREQASGSVSARFPQPHAVPGFPFNRSISMPQQALPGGHSTELSDHAGVQWSGSPRRVVGAYGLGAYTGMHRHTAASVPLYQPDHAVTSILHSENRISNVVYGSAARSGLSSLQKDSTRPKTHTSPGYALYEG
jgi:hypothetical protein